MFLYNKGQPAGCGGASHGGIAQLGERLNGIQEVSGSIPLISTTQTGEVFASPVFSFYAAFRPLHPPPNKAAKALRSRSPSPAAADAPESGPTARKAAPQPASMRVGRNGRPTHRRRRETRGATAFGFLTVRFFNSAAVTPHAAKKFARRQRPFSRRYSLRAPLDDNHGSRRHDDGENAGAGRRSAETPRSGRSRAPTIPAELRFLMPVRSNAPPAKRAHTDNLSKQDTPTGKTHKSLMDIWLLDIKIFAPLLRAKSTCFKGLLYKNLL